MQSSERRLYASIATVFCTAIPTVAAGQPPHALPPIRIVASPIIQGDSVDRFGALTTTVGEVQVRDLAALDLASALRRTPGVSIVRFNPVGAFGGGTGGAVFVRGMGASRPGSEIKTFIEGVPLYLSVWNHPLLDLLPVQGMEHVSVHKGPQPHKFGNAFAAVDLVPRRATRNGTHGDLSLAGGSLGTQVQQLTLAARTGRFDLALSQGAMRSDGHRPAANGEMVNALLHAGFRVADRWRVEATAAAASNNANDPGRIGEPETRTGRFDTRAQMLTVALRHDHVRASGALRVYRSSGNGDWYFQPSPDGNTLSAFTLTGAQLRESMVPWHGALLATGIDVDQIAGRVHFQRVPPAPTTRFDSPTLRITQPHLSLAQHVPLPGNWSLTPSAGARWYAHSELSRATAPHGGLLLERGDNFALRVRGARGVNYPGVDAIVLSSIIPALGESWRTLEAEQLDQFEAGLSFALPGARFRLPMVRRAAIEMSRFEHRARNRYQFAFPPLSTPPSFINLGRYTTRGIEASLHVELRNGLSTFAAVTALDPNDTFLPFTPRRNASAGVVWQSEFLRVSADMQAQGEMTGLPHARSASPVEFPRVSGFTVWQLRAAVPVRQLGPTGEVFANMENVFDRDYAYLPGYPMPGRWGMVGVRAGF